MPLLTELVFDCGFWFYKYVAPTALAGTDLILNVKQNVILLLACLATHIAMGEPSLAEKNAAENAAIKRNGSLGTRILDCGGK
jgi:hypothetical protein